MHTTTKRRLALLLMLALAGTFALLIPSRMKNGTTPPSAPTPHTPPNPAPPPPTKLSILAEEPHWDQLDTFQNTITRADFERLLTTVFVTGGAWRNFIEIDDTEARIRTEGDAIFHLRFAQPGHEHPVPRAWHASADLALRPPGKPLTGLHIAIDPGHIGGDWAQMEERWFQLGNGTPVCEGNMTLLVAQLLQPRLEALGARVSLVRSENQPITPLRPDDLLEVAKDPAKPVTTSEELRKLAERLFYRTAEIRARAKLVNETLKPDLVICIHFNADPWGDPAHPTLVPRSHLHLILNGAYTDEEVALGDQRFALLEKILSRTYDEESRISTTVADVFATRSGLPPYTYPADSANARPINGHPYLWARNLLANRLYQRPVIYMEPWLMNSATDYARIQAGDYDGLREINGKPQPSIFREYADTLTAGLLEYYTAP